LKGGVKTRAEKINGEWVINGEKMWCTNAGLASHIVTLVRTDPAGGSRSLSLIIVPAGSPGLSIAPAEKKMGTRASPAHAVSFSDVRVPDSCLLGKEGYGLKYTLATLDSGRISIGALSLGLAQAAFDAASAYAAEREVMGQAISKLQAIQWMLADAAVDIHAARLMIYQAAYLKEIGQPFTREAASAKLFSTEMAERVCRSAIQIHGGYGVSTEYPVERMYRDARIMTIGEGTSEIQRLVIARSVLDL
jgi:alkylation response protein AidB-like acyl-CoA dehydrogenase